jgi:hypothetical protein
VQRQHQAVQRVSPNPGIKYAAQEENHKHHKREAHRTDAGSARALRKSVVMFI